MEFLFEKTFVILNRLNIKVQYEVQAEVCVVVN